MEKRNRRPDRSGGKMSIYVPTDEDRKAYEGLEIVILTPVGSYEVHAKFAKCVANLIAYSWMHGLKVYQMGITERMVVDWARNDLARQASEQTNEYTGNKFSHFLWLDDDHVFNPDLACYLARLADLDMVSALYFGRTQHLPVAYVKDDSGDKYKHYPLIEAPRALAEVDAVGFGALLMRRDVFDRVPEPWFTLDWHAGEDIAFCVRAKEHGVKVWLDGSYALGHIGPPQIVTEATYKQYLIDHAEEFKDRIKVPLGSAA